MGAMRVEGADAPSLVAEEDDLLAQELLLARQVLQLVRGTGRLPVAAQEFAHRAAGIDAGQLVIGWRRLSAMGCFHRLLPCEMRPWHAMMPPNASRRNRSCQATVSATMSAASCWSGRS